MSKMPPSRSRRFKLILWIWSVLIIGILALLSCEVYERARLRWVYHRNPLLAPLKGPDIFDPEHDTQQPLWVRGPEKSLREFNPRYRPNASITTSGVAGQGEIAFSTNNRGWRGAEIESPKPDGIFRIVCIGGSTTVYGSRDHLTYPAILERELRARFGHERIEVVNCGISGIFSVTQINKIEDYLREEPDLVIDYFGVNDICGILIPLWRSHLGRAHALALESKFLANNFNHLFAPTSVQISSDLWDLSILNLDKVCLKFQQHDVDFVVCTFAYPRLDLCDRTEREYFRHRFRTMYPESHLIYDTYCSIVDSHNKNLLEWTSTREVPLLQLAGELNGTADVFYDICHLNTKGIERKAQIIADQLEPYLVEHYPALR